MVDMTFENITPDIEHPAHRAAKMVRDLHVQNIEMMAKGHVFLSNGVNINDEIATASAEQIAQCDLLMERFKNATPEVNAVTDIVEIGNYDHEKTPDSTLNAADFMMMDVHRPLTDEEINEIAPQAVVDKTTNPKIRLLDPLPDNVVVADVATSHRLQVNRVLQSALEADLTDIIVMGRYEGGKLYLLGSDPSITDMVYILELAKQKLLSVVKDVWDYDDGTTYTRDYPDDPA